jgi:hypothetical protein
MGAGHDGELLTFARERLLAEIERSAERIWLASPFITAPIAAKIVDAVSASGASDRRLLTALSPRSVKVGVLDPAALSKLLGAGFQIASIPNLHAKVSLVDGDWGLVGSGNLTGTGLGGADGGNAELGAVLSAGQIAEAEAIFAGWWQDGESVDAAKIAEFAALPRFPRPKAELGDVGSPIELTGTAALAEILAEDPATAAARRYWIKSNYHRPDEESWWSRGWISDVRLAPYSVGDLIFLYLAARDGGPARCPALVSVTAPSHHDEQWLRDHGDAAAAERWPFVTRVAVVADVPAKAGVQLELIGKNGQSVQGGYCSVTRAEFEILGAALA